MLPVPVPLQKAVCAQASFSGGRKAPISWGSVFWFGGKQMVNKATKKKTILQ